MEAAAQPPPNLEALSKAQLEATAHHNAAHRRHTLCEQARHELRSRAVSVKSAVAALGPSEQEAQLVERLADSVSGAGPDNARRLRLSAFVLGARLAEVAAFANERLVVMSDGRYALVHHDGKGSHGARGGLGLRVSDSWTGQTRDTASLSGGESFMASLALALGLGDAVRAEAGGFDLQTLFVDEGFGSLDEDSLEQVMSVLDALREGGRSVGIVSHVAELRHRIPSQLLVEKGRSGSTIRRQVYAGA
jgi:exonuclease SbcC